MSIPSKFLQMAILALCVASCQSRSPDVLDDLGQSVLKSKEGLEIEIRPENIRK